MESEELKEITEIVRSRYDRVASIYDFLEIGMEFFFTRWRRKLWKQVPSGKILEVGIGTGKNIKYYRPEHRVTGIDISQGMLEKAVKRSDRLGKRVVLELADVQQLPYPDNSFDSAVTTCVFCSVPDPVLGLKEVHRVLRPGGKLLMLEHVLSHKKWLRRIMLLLDFIPFRIWGAHINRETVDNLEKAGFKKAEVTPLFSDVVDFIVAKREGENEQ